MKSLFITFEGIEGCGKSTQAMLLHKALTHQGIANLWTREPGGTPISEMIRHILLDPKNTEMTHETELLLYIASRSQHTFQVIVPALKSGKFVICDRFTDSTLAYQGAARKIDIDTIRPINLFATRGLMPDMTFVIDLPIDVAKERLATRTVDRMEAESAEFHQTVRDAFLDLAKKDQRYKIVDGNRDVEVIHNEIWQLLTHKYKEIRKLGVRND